MALIGVAPPRRLRALADEAAQRQFDQWFEWELRLRNFLSTLRTGGADTTIINIAQERFIFDRFIGGNVSQAGASTNANIGELSWNTAFTTNAGAVGRVASTSGHMGIVRVSGHATLGGHQAMYLGHAAASGNVIELDEVDYFEFIVKNVGTGRFRFGIGDDAAAAGLGNNSIYVSANADVSTTWSTITGLAGVGTTTTTSVGISTNWITWQIQIISPTEIRFFADGALVATHTTNIPLFTTLMAPAVQAVTITPGPFQGVGEIDTYSMLRAA